MRRLAIFTAATHHSGVIHNLISSTQKLQFPDNSDGKIIKHHRHLHLLHDPAEIRSLDEAKSFHAFVITSGPFPTQEPVFLYNNLVSKYASFGDIHMARRLFDEMPQRNVVSYNSMISCYSRDGFLKEALGLFSEMRKCDFKPTEFTFGGLLLCQSLGVLEGIQLQALIEKTGFLYVDAFAGTALLGMYARHGCLDEALGIFEFMPKKNLVTWNSMIHVFGQMGYIEDCIFMLSELMRSRVPMSEYTFISVFTSLEEFDIELGEQIHGLVIKYGFNDTASVCNCLINMYAKSGATCLAEKMFEYAPVKDIVSWNTLIGAMANSDTPAKTLYIFLKMCMTGLSPNEITFANLLSSCSRVHILSYGKYIHAKMIKKRFESDMYAGSALVNLYAKCDKVQEASICFDGITQKNLVSWNSLMLAYSNRDSFSVRLLQEMIHSGYYPNGVSFSIVIKSSLKAELLQLHAITIKRGYHENAYVSSSLISSYARNACSRNGDYKETFELFHHMRASELSPDNYTFVSLFNVCTKLCNLALGSSLHGLIVKTDFKLCDTFVCNAMIDMYGKCGSLQSSVKIFNEMTEKNIISWTALVSVLGLHGHANEALQKFREMERMGIKPDKVAFLSVLSACRHVGLVKQGMDLFSQMKPMYGIEPDIDHYLLVVDLLTGHGHIKEAEQLILGMPIPPNALIWRSFLDGCKKQRTKDSLAFAV
ncbi:UNVERIFIED_CONTAM: Pentatricopeptide repeat-containing protein [Sesamum radiatum]|uniref:Pentatricopeptide repeat-containing protein n=1 Tax=Sesamum radiatum TaxID=300843 RepID=A0AAW2T5D3_SESRA